MDIKVPQSWQAAVGGQFQQPYFKTLRQFVDGERAAMPNGIFPPEQDVFAALKLTPLGRVKVLLLGQDPYINQGQAHGLCFSVRSGIKPPPSLANIFKELRADLGLPIPDHGFLVSWARQGVLMLNTILTVRAGLPLSHQRKGWETFTDAVIAKVNAKKSPVVFVLWGRPAQAKSALIDTGRHVIVAGAHPSPLSAHNGFFGSKPFSAVNRALLARCKTPIDWRLPDAPF